MGTEAYNQQTKSARTCGWMCFLMNKKQKTTMMIQNHKNKQAQVVPQMPLKERSSPAQYQNDDEVCFSRTTTADLRDQNEQQEYQGEEAPWRRLSKDEWQMKRRESKRN